MADEARVQEECRKELTAIITAMMKLLAEFGTAIRRSDRTPTNRLTVLLGAIMKAQESSRAIVYLGKIGAVDEMNVLLRTLVELVVNVCYFQHASDAELKRFLKHDAIAGYIAMKDFSKATQGTAPFPSDLELRITNQANLAKAESGLGLDARLWNVETKTLKKRADKVDATIGGSHFAQIMASVYVTGSGYTHAGFKTIHRYCYYLMTGKGEQPLVNTFGVANAIHGVSYALHVFGRYIALQHGFDLDAFDSLEKESLRIVEVSREDLRLHRKAQQNPQA
jgi:hypothetical protein